jgi:hypothetical protein
MSDDAPSRPTVRFVGDADQMPGLTADIRRMNALGETFTRGLVPDNLAKLMTSEVASFASAEIAKVSEAAKNVLGAYHDSMAEQFKGLADIAPKFDSPAALDLVPYNPTNRVAELLEEQQEALEAREEREQAWRDAMMVQARADAERARQAEERELAAEARAAAGEKREISMVRLNVVMAIGTVLSVLSAVVIAIAK